MPKYVFPVHVPVWLNGKYAQLWIDSEVGHDAALARGDMAAADEYARTLAQLSATYPEWPLASTKRHKKQSN